MSDLDDVLVRDDAGKWARYSVRTHARLIVDVDCKCWRHKDAHVFEAITTIGGGLYVRTRAADPVPYREIESNGPITLTITRV